MSERGRERYEREGEGEKDRERGEGERKRGRGRGRGREGGGEKIRAILHKNKIRQISSYFHKLTTLRFGPNETDF
jgi:hypothetical protein